MQSCLPFCPSYLNALRVVSLKQQGAHECQRIILFMVIQPPIKPVNTILFFMCANAINANSLKSIYAVFLKSQCIITTLKRWLFITPFCVRWQLSQGVFEAEACDSPTTAMFLFPCVHLNISLHLEKRNVEIIFF